MGIGDWLVDFPSPFPVPLEQNALANIAQARCCIISKNLCSLFDVDLLVLSNEPCELAKTLPCDLLLIIFSLAPSIALNLFKIDILAFSVLVHSKCLLHLQHYMFYYSM
jgi:hypothetical protein